MSSRAKLCKVLELLVGGPNGRDKLIDLVGVFEALVSWARQFDTRTHIHRQRFTARAYLQNAIDDVGSVEPTTQDEVSVDAWRKK